MICTLSVSSFGQNRKIDSLLNLIKTDKPDTNKLVHLNNLSRKYFDIGYYEAALLHANFAEQQGNEIFKKATNLSVKKAVLKNQADSYNNIGLVYYAQGNYSAALKKYFKSLRIREVIGDKKNATSSYNNIGLAYDGLGNYPEALKNHYFSLKIREALNDKKGIAHSYNNIGSVYSEQGNDSEALKNCLASLKIKKEIGDTNDIAITYSALGGIYFSLGNYQEAYKNHLACLKIMETSGDKRGEAVSYLNIGNIYSDQGNYPVALKNYFHSLKLKIMIGNDDGIANLFNNIGYVYFKQKKYDESKEYLLRSEKLSKEFGYKEYLESIYSGLAELDSAKGDFKGAYENHKLYVLYRDSLDNEETRKKTIQTQMTYDFEKKEAVANAEHKKELENQQVLAEEKSRKQKIVIVFVVGGLFLVMVFAGFVFRSLRVTRKQKDVIEQQKNIVEQQKQEVEQQKLKVEDHQKDIIDSITYARRIQRSLLPTESYIEKNLKRLNKRI